VDEHLPKKDERITAVNTDLVERGECSMMVDERVTEKRAPRRSVRASPRSTSSTRVADASE